MPIPESQLETWSHQGSIQQSAATYQSIRGVLNDPKSPYYSKSFEIFLQGSYANDTNVWRDSDVDIVIRLDSAFQSDLDYLGEDAKSNYQRTFEDATYGFPQFKTDVLSWLYTNYGTDVRPGGKAITILARGSRREADVLPCIQFRMYTRGSTGSDDNYHEGIVFWKTDGTRIINFPKQHSANCTTKHQDTSLRFKPNVRVFKNMRNRMVDLGLIRDGLAPSYFIEGMLYNVPADCFRSTFGDTFVAAVTWLQKCDRSALVCANGLYKLLHDGSPVCWNKADFEAFLVALVDFWQNWSQYSGNQKAS